MYNILRHRRLWLVLPVAFIFVLLFHVSDLPKWMPWAEDDQETSVPEDASLDALFQSTNQLNQLYANEPHAHQRSVRWSDADGIPETRIFAHIPGFTVLQNVYTVNGTLFLVSDSRRSLPVLKYMLSAYTEIPGGRTLVDLPMKQHIRVIDRKTAIRVFGLSARELRGATWLCNDALAYTDESFVLEFLRTHYMQEHRAHFNASVLPPTRVLFPRISNRNQNKIPGLSSIPRLLFPSSGVGFKEDWEDYASGNRPFVLETVVLLDRGAASRNPKLSPDAEQDKFYLEIGSPLASFRQINADWWAYWRKRMGDMVSSIDITGWHGENASSIRPVITYFAHQGQGMSLVDAADHQRLVDQLEKLGIRNGYDINVVDPAKMGFVERVRLSLRTTIMIGPTGASLSDVIWMHPSSLSLLLELFPESYISTKRLHIARAVGVPYLAWKDASAFTPDELIAHSSSSALRAANIDELNKQLRIPMRVDAESVCAFILSRLEKDQGEDTEDMR